MSFRNRLLLLIISFSVLLVTNNSLCMADDPFEVVIGQDAVFTLGNITDTTGDAYSNGTSAYAQVDAGPYTSGISTAKAGVRFRVVESPEGIDYLPAIISITFDYSITVDFSDILPVIDGGGGSADASVSAYIGGAGAYQELVSRINFVHTANFGEDSGTRTVTGSNQGLYANETYDVNTDLYAHADVYKGNHALAYADTDLTEVRIHFLKPVEAKITTDPDKPHLEDTITFDSSESQGSEFVSWEWDFGDKQTASGPVVTHAYQNTGTYTAHLTITDIDGHTGSDEKKLVFEPDIKSDKSFLNFLLIGVDDVISNIFPSFGWVNISNSPAATANLNITDVKVEGDAASAVQIFEDCKGKELANPDSCIISPITITENKEGIAFLDVYYDGADSPLSIPIQIKSIGLRTEKEAELTKKASQILKDVIQKQTIPVPPPVVFYDKIPDFTPLMGKTMFFGAPNVGTLLMSTENVDVWPTTIQFKNYLSTFSLEDGTEITYLPYTQIENNGEEEGGVLLANYVDIEDGDRWFTVIREDSEFHIDQFTVPAYKFSLFQTDGQQAQGYDITYCVDSDEICDISLVQGSSNVFDIVQTTTADIDSDRDVDGKDLVAFITNAVNGLPSSDLNGDGETNAEDVRLFSTVFGSSD